MKKVIFIGVFIVIAAGLLWVAWMYWQDLRGVGPALKPPPDDIAELLSESGSSDKPKFSRNETEFPLSLPDNFSISVLTDDVPGARVMKLDGQGYLWVSQTKQGKVSRVNLESGEVEVVLSGLNNPHGLAFDPDSSQSLYVAEEDKIIQVDLQAKPSYRKIIDLPAGGRHATRTIGFGPDGKLYVSIGSSCDVCFEKDERRAAIYRLDKNGGNFELFARGLRNAVFFTWNYVNGKMWATEMGRDRLGDDLPPDEINIVEKGKDYGWPLCFGKNVHDTNFDKNKYIQDSCSDREPSYIDLPAHSAPLGLAFVPEEGWPEEYWYDLVVAYHGSWNRSEPTGYKLVRFKLDAMGRVLGQEDFISGWLREDGALGRPADVLIQPGGIMYVSDDKAGVIYKISYL